MKIWTSLIAIFLIFYFCPQGITQSLSNTEQINEDQAIADLPESYNLFDEDFDQQIPETPEEKEEIQKIEELPTPYNMFDDSALLNGFTDTFKDESKEILLAMIKDDTISQHKMAAAVRVFKTKYSQEVFSREKHIIEKMLLQRLNRTDSPFVQVEIMHTLCLMDRYKYFKTMVPALIQKLDHYNSAVNELSYESLNNIVENGKNRAREARIIFTTLRKVLFLSRKRLATLEKADTRLSQKLKILRWSIKILGTQELKRLPQEVINHL